MKIQPGQSEPIAVQPLKVRTPETTSEPQQTDQMQDNFSPTQNKQLLAQINNLPDTRSDALSKAQQLAADPNYPSSDIIGKLAGMFVNEAE